MGQRQRRREQVDVEADELAGEDVRLAVNRCPFCHEGVSARESVVCQECLARHHEPCWTEAGACASCGSARRMNVSLGVRLRDLREVEQEAVRLAALTQEPRALRLTLGVLFAALTCVVFFGTGWVLLDVLTREALTLELVLGLAVFCALAWYAGASTAHSARARLRPQVPGPPARAPSLAAKLPPPCE